MNHLVLIAEDEPLIALVLRETLADEGFAVETAGDGLSALHRLRAGPLPAVLLLDLGLPEMSGRELLRALRADPRLARVPVVLVTGSVPDAPEFPPPGTYQDVVYKPFAAATVLAAVQRLLRRQA